MSAMYSSTKQCTDLEQWNKTKTNDQDMLYNLKNEIRFTLTVQYHMNTTCCYFFFCFRFTFYVFVLIEMIWLIDFKIDFDVGSHQE